MATLLVSADAVLERMNAMRIAAEESLSRVQTYLASNPQPLARVVAGYRGLVATAGSRIIHAQAGVDHEIQQVYHQVDHHENEGDQAQIRRHHRKRVHRNPRRAGAQYVLD